METDNIWLHCGCAICSDIDAVKILVSVLAPIFSNETVLAYLDVSQAVTSKLKVIRTGSGTSISEIESHLSVKWSAGICIWNGLMRC
jgi:hypothetical protein